MNSVKLSVKMADEMLSYFRKHLEAENEGYSKFLKDAKEFTEKEFGLDGELKRSASELAMKMCEKKHEQKVATYTKFIEYLTVGVEEDEEVKVVSC